MPDKTKVILVLGTPRLKQDAFTGQKIGHCDPNYKKKCDLLNLADHKLNMQKSDNVEK